jgi:predicted RNA binding protein YcfA (HicA-like mRNA interferase family)
MVVWGGPDAAQAEAEVTASLERGGWQPVAPDGSERVFQREDRVLRLTAVSDGKATDVRLTLP